MRQAAHPASGRASSRRIIERPRLLKLLDEAAARTILLIAPAGYGKTTLARQWAERQQGVHWYTARTGSADVAQLAVDLAGALDGAAPGLLTYASELVRALPNPAQSPVLIAEGLATVAPNVAARTLVLDDFHEIAIDEGASRFVQELQIRLGLRLVVASRVRPAWATARLEVYGDSIELGPDDLALTSGEAAEVLGRSSSSATAFFQSSRGWPAVVGLAARAEPDVTNAADATAATLFRFFAEELFQATAESAQRHLLTLALLPKLSPQLITLAMKDTADLIIDQAIESGLATVGQGGVELHPLVREYLLAKLAHEPNIEERVRDAVRLSLDAGFPDHAFELVKRFNANDLLDPLIEMTFKSLLASGRVATAEQIAAYGHSTSHVSPLIDLIDAEIAFRSGLFARAEAVAARVARGLGDTHPLSSHASWIAGQGAQMNFRNSVALDHFDRARATAATDDDLRDALWGAALTSCQAETPAAAKRVRPLLSRRSRSSIDNLRATAAEILLERITGTGRPIELSAALHAVDSISDPRIRTSFLNACAYYLILRAKYHEASEAATKMCEIADAYQLTWARPHAHWALAATAFGRRQFADASAWVTRVERAGDEARSGTLLLNAACLRARQLLALQQPDDALKALTVDETLPVNRGMRGEFYAVKALALATLGEEGASRKWVRKARTITRCIEARAYAMCAESILALPNPDHSLVAMRLVTETERTGTWDAFVSSMRACPKLLEVIAKTEPLTPAVIAALRDSYDFDLSKQAGLDIGRRPRTSHPTGTLTRREREVLDLIGQGYTNQDIARALFIAKSTVKVHVRHILEKTGARSRTDAATQSLGGES